MEQNPQPNNNYSKFTYHILPSQSTHSQTTPVFKSPRHITTSQTTPSQTTPML